MPPGFIVCRPCWRELPFKAKAELFTAQSRAHFKDLYPFGEYRFTQALAAALNHLRQHSTALL